MNSTSTSPALTIECLTTGVSLTATTKQVSADLYEVTINGKVRGEIGLQGPNDPYPGKPYTQHISIGEHHECGDTIKEALEDFLLVYVAEPDCLDYVR